MKFLLTLLTLVTLSACCGKKPTAESNSSSLEKWVGTEVTVQFKRDQLGAGDSPIAPNTTWLNNTKVSLNGKIVSAHSDGIFLDSHYKMNSGDKNLRNSIFWIPHDSILTVESKKAPDSNGLKL